MVIRKVRVYAHGHNNDGVDPEMSQNVLIEDCVFDQGDDAIAIKSNAGIEGWRLKTRHKMLLSVTLCSEEWSPAGGYRQ